MMTMSEHNLLGHGYGRSFVHHQQHHVHHASPSMPPSVWARMDEPGSGGNSSVVYPVSGGTSDVLSALQAYQQAAGGDYDESDGDGDFAGDGYSGDEFRMYEFKVRRCARSRSHDWTECPFAHPGEKARRRDPRRYHYSGTACPDFRKGSCKRGDSCEFAHGVFECWLHPSRYRTQPCKDGTACRRVVCFFAHTPEQLRVLPAQASLAAASKSLPESYDGSPMRRTAATLMLSTSPTSTLGTSPPRSPTSDPSPPVSPESLLATFRQLSLGQAKASPFPSSGNALSCSWSGCGFTAASPRFRSLPTTPKAVSSPAVGVIGGFDCFDLSLIEEEPAMERVESGRALRERMMERLSKDGGAISTLASSAGSEPAPGPDVGWVSDLLN